MKYMIKVSANFTNKESSKLYKGKEHLFRFWSYKQDWAAVPCSRGGTTPPWIIGAKLMILHSVQVAACIMNRKFRNVSFAPACKIFCRHKSCWYETTFTVNTAVSNAIKPSLKILPFSYQILTVIHTFFIPNYDISEQN